MMNQNISDWLIAAKEEIAKNNLRGASVLLKQVLDQDFTNLDAWQLLHHFLASNETFEQFQTSFAQKYYPSKVYLLKNTGNSASKKYELTLKLAELEKQIASWERYNEEQKKLEDDAKRQLNWSWAGVIVGIFLAPIIVGIILIVAGLLAVGTQNHKRDQARNNQTNALANIEKLKQSMAQTRAELSLLS